MRFSDTLRLNAKAEWWEYYVPYDELKRRISALKYLRDELFIRGHTNRGEEVNHAEESSDEERQDHEEVSPRRKPLRRSASVRVLEEIKTETEKHPHGYGAMLKTTGLPHDELIPLDATAAEVHATFNRQESLFQGVLQNSVVRIESFYGRMANELEKITKELEQDAQVFLNQPPQRSASNETENLPLLNIHEPSSPGVHLNPVRLRRRFLEHYQELGETINFSSLNRTAFDKILKKHDKYTSLTSRWSVMQQLDTSTTFTDVTCITLLQNRTVNLYAKVFCNGQTAQAKKELDENLRYLIVWDRSTVWREVLRTERRVSVFHSIPGGEQVDLGKAAHAVTWRPQIVPVTIAILVFLILLLFPQVTRSLPVKNGREYSMATLDAAHRCLALTACVVILWATEGIPLYVTSFLVVPGAILLRVFVNSDGRPHSAHEASKEVFGHLSSDTLLLIVCVYALGAALSKFDIDKVVATAVLSKIKRAEVLLLALMTLGVIVSMFVSNVAAPVLLNSVMMPTFNALRSSNYNRRYVECLLLGIMVSSNIGGFASPISSPQSAVGFGLLTGANAISFAKWLYAALPLCALMVLVFYVALSIIYKPSAYNLPPVPVASEKFSFPHFVVTGTLVVTIFMWAYHPLTAVFGSPGIVAVIPILILFGSGILIKEDFNNLPWDVVYLVAGGVVLGAAVESCKLLDLIAERLLYVIGTEQLRLTYVVFSVFLALVANFVSHTVSAIVVLPLVFKIGVSLGHPKMMVLAGTFAASCAMALPISSFPNISAIQVEDETGDAYLRTNDIVKVGSLMTVLATIVLLAPGYDLMLWLHL
ncbi:putative transporter [Gracilariopsis chorda]|uniref:Putative transporter n=1 Tax=Gracilariopsis chorda TaxID=448386 RepID=A0A2V3IUS9_9FLOR|nr:putative transporter [Gracilariopsis chorda]|eukprot:PXF45874.1 putative transporter [Gracilariopsis chorda]